MLQKTVEGACEIERVVEEVGGSYIVAFWR